MASPFPVLDQYKDDEFKDEFLKKYGKNFKIPAVKTIFAKFHPLVQNHVITINKIDFPKIGKDGKIKTMIHEKMEPNFLTAIESKYITDARKNEIKKGKKVAEVLTFKKESEVSGSLPEEPDSELWLDSDEDYDGGEDQKETDNHIHLNGQEDTKGDANTSLKKPKKIKSGKAKKRKVGKSCFSKFQRNKQTIQTVELSYPKEIYTSKGEFRKKAKEEADEAQKEVEKDEVEHYIFNKAADMYIDDNNLMFSYRDFHENLTDEDEIEHLRQYDEANSPMNHYSMSNCYPDIIYSNPYNKIEGGNCVHLDYRKVPTYKEMNYVPPPF